LNDQGRPGERGPRTGLMALGGGGGYLAPDRFASLEGIGKLGAIQVVGNNTVG